MSEPKQSLPLAPLALIAIIIGLGAAAFAYTAGWFSPARISPAKLVDAFTPPGGKPPLGHRRNHAKGICFTGVFQANGAGSELSRAEVFKSGSYPVLGRFNLGTADPNAADATVRVRGVGIRIKTPDGQQWRSAMIDAPFFAASTPQSFYQLLTLPPKDPDAMKAYAATHPPFVAFGAWAKSAPWTASYAEERFNGLNLSSSPTVPARRTPCAGRWCRRRNRSPSPLPISPSAGLISWNRTSRNGSEVRRNAGRWF
jgi:catalase